MCVVEEESEVWKEMDPDSFRPFSVPFKLDGDTQVSGSVMGCPV